MARDKPGERLRATCDKADYGAVTGVVCGERGTEAA